MSKKTFYITTPIYYPSGNLHIGHVYTTTIAWAIRNYKRLVGYDAIILTGADEHGQKIETKAKEMGIKPQEYVDKMNDKFINLWKIVGIDYDLYSRTTNKSHMAAIQKQFSNLYKRGLIYKGEYKGLYSVSDEEFFTKTQAKLENGKYYHPLSGHELKEVSEESYFFKMSEYADWIKEYYGKHPNFIFPKKVKSELLNNFILNGLEDLSVSRNTFNWGIPILEDTKHVIYVWLDALNNYITALGAYEEDSSQFDKYWTNGNEIVHVLGKEIARFHGIYWPIILKANNFSQPSTIISHGWIITPEGKMAKSKGNVVDPLYLIEKYGAEQLKFYLAYKIHIGQDGIFEEEEFVNTLNSTLVNNYGNLVSRTVVMVEKSLEGQTHYVKEKLLNEDKNIFKQIEHHYSAHIKFFDNYQTSYALNEAMELSKKLNGYIDITQPWTLKEDKERLNVVLNTLLNGIYVVSLMLYPVIPIKINQALKQIGLSEINIDLIKDFSKFDNKYAAKKDILFKRI